jgi:hypothetical protein
MSAVNLNIKYNINRDMAFYKDKNDVQISEPKEFHAYEQTSDTFIIYNVPIMAAMVQPYSDGYALKDSEEIKKVEVQGVPITMVTDRPSHPESHLSQLGTKEVADVVVGFMREPSKLKEDASKLKRYADFVLHKTPKVKPVIDAFLKGHVIDTSIGFTFEKDETSGFYNNMKYDYIQRQIRLDHNAILMDAQGNIAEGRMPSPIGGIGADSNDCEDNMKQEEIDALQTKAVEIQTQFDALKASDALVVAERDQLKAEVDALKIEVATIKSASDEVQKQLDAYKTKEAQEIDAMRAELKTKYSDVSELFDSASADLIKSKYADMKKKETAKSSKDIGADMMGPKSSASNSKSEHERINKYAQPGQSK